MSAEELGPRGGVMIDVDGDRLELPSWRQCPHCWPNLKGKGTASRSISPERPLNLREQIEEEYSEDCIGKRYYKCDRCGLSYHIEFVIETHVVTMRKARFIRR